MDINKEDHLLISDIAKRSISEGVGYGDTLSRIMDLEVAHKQFNLKLNDFLNADRLNFTHDFCGIQSHIDRKNAKWVDDMFLPRFAQM